MEINQENVVKKFQLYSGEELNGTEPQRDGLCRALCQECAEWVQEQARPEAPPSAASGAESLAAAEAFYQLALLDQSAGPEAVSAPELKVRLGDRARYAANLRAEKRKACGRILAREDFYFGQA